MDGKFSLPQIEPTTFDIIIIGTGLPASVIAAAASVVGKSVLHLDPNPFYGSYFSSLSPDEVSSFLQSEFKHTVASRDISSRDTIPPPFSTEDKFVTAYIKASPVYSKIEICSHSLEPIELSTKFNLDLAGPRVLFCGDSLVDLLKRSGASQYMDFKCVEAGFVPDSDGGFWKVPDSRQAIFLAPNLALKEKTWLRLFFRSVHNHLAPYDSENGETLRISQEDLESPFVEYMIKKHLTPRIISGILYALAMTDHVQDSMDNVAKVFLKTKDGIDRLVVYLSSVGRLQNVPGALIYPIYGQGELPQAFCRRAAVKCCLYVLRMPVTALLLDQGGHYKGVKLSSGQDIFSQKLVMDPCFMVHMPLESNLPQSLPKKITLQDSNAKMEVARAICIIKGSPTLFSNASNVLLVYPPKSLYPEQAVSIRALQIGSDLGVCPPGMFVLYLSAVCDGFDHGKTMLNAAIKSLLSYTKPGDENRDPLSATAAKPTLLWSALYNQQLTVLQSSFESISFTPLPDGNINYDFVLEATKKVFEEMYPFEQFFPVSHNFEEDD